MSVLPHEWPHQWHCSRLVTGSLFARFNPFSYSGADDEVVKLLAKQLDRCGPENLKVAPPVEHCPYRSLALAFLAGLSTGFTVCLFLGLAVFAYFRCRVQVADASAVIGRERTTPLQRTIANADEPHIVVTERPARSPPRGEHLAIGYEELSRQGY